MPLELDTSSSVFASTTEKEIQGLLKKNKNRNTIKLTATWVRRFEKWKYSVLSFNSVLL